MAYPRTAALRKLHILGKERGFDHEELRSLAAALYKVKSLAELTNQQLSHFIEHIQGAASAGPAPIANGATKRQLWKINQLNRQLDWHSNPDRLAGFIARQCKGKTHLNELTVWEASRVIEGLKKLERSDTPQNSAEPAEANPCTTANISRH